MTTAATDFTTLSTPEHLEGGRFRAIIPDGWQQGRGAFGGLVVALLTRAVERYASLTLPGAVRPVRSITSELCGPTMVGEAELLVEALRVGSGVATLAVRLVQGGEVQAHAVCLLGKERPVDVSWLELTPPVAPSWDELLPMPIDSGIAPVFARHLEYRITDPLPFCGSTEAIARGRVRLREPGAARDAAHLVALADAWWPAAFSRFDTFHPMSTVAFTLQITCDATTVDPAEPLVHTARAVAAQAGFVVEFRELWDTAGRLVALNQQTFAVIK